MTGEQPAKDRTGPSTRAIILWGAGMLAALALAWFVGAVAVPVWRTRRSVIHCTNPEFYYRDGMTAEIERLGGPEVAAWRLRSYVSLPRPISVHPLTAVRMLDMCGDTALPHLMVLFRNEDAYVRAYAAYYLRKRKDPRSVESMFLALKDEREGVRVDAICVLRLINDPRTREQLLPLLRDGHWMVRCHVAMALEDMGDRRDVEPLEKLLDDEHEQVRSAAVQALKKIRGGTK